MKSAPTADLVQKTAAKARRAVLFIKLFMLVLILLPFFFAWLTGAFNF